MWRSDRRTTVILCNWLWKCIWWEKLDVAFTFFTLHNDYYTNSLSSLCYSRTIILVILINTFYLSVTEISSEFLICSRKIVLWQYERLFVAQRLAIIIWMLTTCNLVSIQKLIVSVCSSRKTQISRHSFILTGLANHCLKTGVFKHWTLCFIFPVDDTDVPLHPPHHHQVSPVHPWG